MLSSLAPDAATLAVVVLVPVGVAPLEAHVAHAAEREHQGDLAELDDLLHFQVSSLLNRFAQSVPTDNFSVFP